MTSYQKSSVRPAVGKYEGFDHVTFWVGNAKQAASYYVTKFGFDYLGYKGLETGNRQVVSYSVRLSGITFVFQSPLTTDNRVFGEHLILHGDCVKDVAFTVDDVRGIYNVSFINIESNFSWWKVD
jgi:4-hydroxyphenylpyruvate dioxygenase